MTRSSQGFFFLFFFLNAFLSSVVDRHLRNLKKKKLHIQDTYPRKRCRTDCTNALNHLIKMRVGLQHRENK